jgi:hypothetical protein
MIDIRCYPGDTIVIVRDKASTVKQGRCKKGDYEVPR